MSAEGHAPGGGEHLVTMVNDIANYFRAQGREAAIAGIAAHLKRYWTPRMLQKLNVHLTQGHGGLDELSQAAVDRLNAQGPAASNPTTGSQRASP
jgi:formate dehydrogenase subunit delta